MFGLQYLYVSSPQDSLAAAEETTMIEELDIVNLAPRKPDWDLKRDIAKKLEKCWLAS